MRKKNVSFRFPMVLKAFLLSLPLFFSASLSAQQQFPDLVDASTALQRITEVLPDLRATLVNLSEGTPEHAFAERSLLLHTHTWEFLTQGNDVSTSLSSAFEEFAINAQGGKAQADELAGMTIIAYKDYNYDDPAFDALVKYLED